MIICTLTLLLGGDGLWRKGERKRSPSPWVVHAVHYEVSRRIKLLRCCENEPFLRSTP